MEEERLLYIELFIIGIFIMIVIGTIAICNRLDKKDKYSLDYQIETYIDDDGICYRILRNSNGDTVYVDTRYDKWKQ